jgi:NADPH-dependent ferric siderophore reductase
MTSQLSRQETGPAHVRRRSRLSHGGLGFTTAELIRTDQLTPRLRRLYVAAPGRAWTPGQHVRVVVSGPARSWAGGFLPGGTLRSYSVFDYDGSVLQLCVLDHGNGPGARWARAARPGDLVRLSAPQGRMVVQAAPYFVFAGEETAAVTFGPMLRTVGTARVYGVIEVDSRADRLPLHAGLSWRYREGRPAADSSGLVAAVAGLDLPSTAGLAYVAGEARTVQAIRSHLVRDRGWPRRQVVTKPYWTPGRTGMD